MVEVVMGVEDVVERPAAFGERALDGHGVGGVDGMFHGRSCERGEVDLVMEAGRHILPLGDDVWAVPISALWA